MVENEDLRDRAYLMAAKEGSVIEYLPYLAPKQLEKSIAKTLTTEELA